MNNLKRYLIVIYAVCLIISIENTGAQNPVIRDQYAADPSARVFDGKVYLYPSHDILATEGKGRIGWFCMEDYHVFSSEDLTEWVDHGVIVSQNKVKWVDSTSYSMWAPDCILKDGKYYFYFPSRAKDTVLVKGFTIGVAISENPYGPFISQSEPIKNVRGIDPNVFIDKDGQAYLYWSARNIYLAKLKDNMLELDSEPKIIANLPEKGLKEGPFLFERNGIYYLTFPHVENKIERLEYAMGKSPMGPFKMEGVIMDESPGGCWTNHHSFINRNNQWYLFYHNNAFSPKFDKNRSVCIDSMFFNTDGTIRKVIPSLRGVGLTDASKKIQIDRYSNISEKGASITFIDSSKTFEGWKIILETKDAWIQYNAVDLRNKGFRNVNMRVSSKKETNVVVRLNSVTGPIIAEVIIPKGEAWNITKATLSRYKPGIHNIFVQLNNENCAEIDWISFK